MRTYKATLYSLFPSKSVVPSGTVGSNPTHSARKLSLQAVFAVCRLFLFLHLWDFSVSSLLKIGSSLLNFLRFELWICSWRILSKAIRRRSYEITSNAPLRPFTIASADDSLEL